MLNMQFLLAQASTQADATEVANPSLVQLAQALKGRIDLLCHPDSAIQPLTELHLVWAVVFVFIGALCVLNGYRWHKTVIVVLAALGGVTLGLSLGPKLGAHGAITAGAAAALIAIVSLPLMRYTAALLAGLAGGFAGANIWTAVTADSSQHFFGAVIGLIVLGMLAFVAFRIVIIAFTSILGSVLLTTGVLSALLKVPEMHPGLVSSLSESPRILPILVGVVATIGFVVQQAGGFKGLNEAANKADRSKAKPAAQTT